MSDGDSSAPVEYREIPGTDGYQIGSDGTVLSYRHTGPGGFRRTVPKVLRQRTHTGKRSLPYKRIALRFGDTSRQLYVHCIVLEAFVGPKPDGMEVGHKDGNPANNSLGNLEYATPIKNVADRLNHGTHQRGNKSSVRKLSEQQVVEIRGLLAAGETPLNIAGRYGVSRGAIYSIKGGKRWWYLKDGQVDLMPRKSV